MSLEHISKSFSKYRNIDMKLDELADLRKQIITSTGITPVSIKKTQQGYVVKVSNQYEALEIKALLKDDIRVVI